MTPHHAAFFMVGPLPPALLRHGRRAGQPLVNLQLLEAPVVLTQGGAIVKRNAP